MLFYENIRAAMGVDIAVSQEMADSILLWNRLYENKAPWLDPKQNVRGCGLPAAIASEMATAVTLEAAVTISGSDRADFLDRQMKPVKMDLAAITEYACAGGGITLKPYIHGNRIAVDYAHSDCFFPVSFSTDRRVTAAIFPEFLQRGKWLYTRLEYQEYDEAAGTYTIRNRAYKSKKAAVKVNDIISLGSEIRLADVPEWEGLEPEIFLTGATCPLFVYFRLPFANNIDRYSPLGVSVYSRAVDAIRDTDEQYGATLWEYKAKEAAVQAGAEFFEKTREGKTVLPKGKERLYRSMGDVTDASGAPFFNVYSPDIRNESFFDGYNRMLQRVEFNSHLAYGTLSDPQTVDKTAEEIKAGKQRSYAAVRAVQNSLRPALVQLAEAMDAWATIGKLAPPGKWELVADFDDSIVVDKDKERQTDRADVAMGAMQLWEYRMKWFGEEEATAKAAVSVRQDDVIE